MLRLADLFDGTTASWAQGSTETVIGHVSTDWRRLCGESLYVAIPGALVDGTTLIGGIADGAWFITQAVKQGARAVLMDQACKVAVPAHVSVFKSPNVRADISRIAARFFPKQPEKIVAITGTCGKTSIAHFTRQIWINSGHSAASIGTHGVVTSAGLQFGPQTTPYPLSLHASLHTLASRGVTHVAMEASSQGLDEHRIDQVRLTAVAFANLDRDHLEYHLTLDAYRRAKLRLFSDLIRPGQIAVVHADDAQSADFARSATDRGALVLTTGYSGEAFKLAATKVQGFGQILRIVHGGREYEVKFPLFGNHQATNALIAAGLAVACGLDADVAIQQIGRLKGVRGRLEVLGTRGGGLVIIDFAHKPKALATALATLRPFTAGKLRVVLGCAGGRDPGERPVMGAIAEQMADVVIVTDHNTRSEQPDSIRRQVLAGAPGAIEIADRTEAIQTALGALGPGDVLLIVGKMTEQEMEVDGEIASFWDHSLVLPELDGSAGSGRIPLYGT